MSSSQKPIPTVPVPFGNAASNLPTYDDVMNRPGMDRNMGSSSRMQGGYNNYMPPQYPPSYPPAYPAAYPAPPPLPQQAPFAFAQPPPFNSPSPVGYIDPRKEQKAHHRMEKLGRRELKWEEKMLKKESKLERKAMKDGVWLPGTGAGRF